MRGFDNFHDRLSRQSFYGDCVVVYLFERGINILNIRLVLDGLVSDHVQDDFGHAAGLTVARALKDDILHLSAAQVLDSLLAQHPGDCVRNVTFAAAIRAYDRSDAVACEDNFRVIGEGFESGDL